MRKASKLISILGLAAALSCGGDNPTEPRSNPSPTQPSQPTQQNRAPTFNYPCLEGNENSFYECRINATDPDGDVLNYSVQGPSWLQVSHNVIFGNLPDVSRDTNFPITVRVSDGRASTEQPYTLTVRNLFNSYIVSSSGTNPLVSAQTNSLTFSEPVNFNVGDILAADTSQIPAQGALRKITSFSSDRRRVNTEQATLEEVIMDGNISISGTVSPLNIQSASSVMTGVSLAPSHSAAQVDGLGLTLNNVVLYDHDKNPLTTNGQLIANGGLWFNTNFDFSADVSGLRLRSLDLGNTSTVNLDLTVGSSITGVASRLEVALGEYYFSPIIVPSPLGGLPIVIVPKVGFYVGIDPTNVNPLSVRVRNESSLETNLIYDRGLWLSDSDFSNNFDFSSPVFTGEWDLKVSATPKLTLLFGGVLGTSAGVSAGLRLESQGFGDWKLYGGLGAGLGASMEIFSKTLASYYKTLIDFEKLLAENTNVTTTGNITDGRDGQVYRTINIGTQTWMAENLDYNAVGSEYYQNNSSYADVYGRLYSWNSSKTACPSNWHLPTEIEWSTLSNYLGGNEVSGGKLKSTGTIQDGTGRWYSPNTGATNEVGFNAQPGGRKNNSTYSDMGSDAYFWAANNTSTQSRFFTYLREGMNLLGTANTSQFKFSIRCVKN